MHATLVDGILSTCLLIQSIGLLLLSRRVTRLEGGRSTPSAISQLRPQSPGKRLG
jgi:hypothetical protein